MQGKGMFRIFLKLSEANSLFTLLCLHPYPHSRFCTKQDTCIAFFFEKGDSEAIDFFFEKQFFKGESARNSLKVLSRHSTGIAP